MRLASELPHNELAVIVDCLQTALFMEDGEWNVNKEVNGADLVDAMTTLLCDHGMTPDVKRPAS